MSGIHATRNTQYRDEAPKDRRPRQREHELERAFGRRIVVETDLELERFGIEGEDVPPTDPPADDAYPQFVPGRRAQDLLRMTPPPTADPRPPTLAVPLLRLDEQTVNARALPAAGDSLLEWSA